MKKPALVALVALMLFALSLIPASAQFYHYSPNRFVNSSVNQFFQKRWAVYSLRVAGKHEAADALEGAVPSQQPAPEAQVQAQALQPYPLSASGYRKTRASVAPEQLVAETPSLSAAEKEELRELYGALLQSYDQLLVANGEERLRDNLAASAAFAIATARLVLSSEELPPETYEALVQDLNSLLASNPAFQDLSHEDRQNMSETFQIYGGLAHSLYAQGQEQGDAQLVQQGRDLSRSLLGQFFECPPEEIQFTANGVILP